MTIEAKIVAHSKNCVTGKEIITYSLVFPRFILPEFNTHRMFSRNASSSRAIPVAKQIQMVEDNPVIPLAFTKNKPGMQGGDLLEGEEHEKAKKIWLEGCTAAIKTAKALMDSSVHKQYANRVLEPYAHISVVCTATDFDNFFALRYHGMAQPEIAALAKAMWEALNASSPNQLKEGDWHIPYFGDGYWSRDMTDLPLEDALKVSTARCARVSYLTHDYKLSTKEEDFALYERLVGNNPKHASPAEHQAVCVGENIRSGNFSGGWVQHRKTLENENITCFDLEAAKNSFVEATGRK